jgi:phosphoesterase RecJ-like protein
MEFAQDQLSQFSSAITNSKKVLIVTHEFPDLDAIGSSLGLYHYLKDAGKEVTIWTAQTLDSTFDFLPGVETIQHTLPPSLKYDTLFVLDASHLNRVRGYKHLKTDLAHVVNIDHHPDNSLFGDVNIMHTVSSVGELLYWLFHRSGIDISQDMATCLYAAISFDTGRFAYSSVTADTHLVGSALISAGAEPYPIFQKMDENKSVVDFELIRLGIERLVSLKDDGIVFTTLPKNSPDARVKMIDVIRQLDGFDVVLVFQELDSSNVKVNLRSKTDFDVSAFAQQFGGGGHKKASGIFTSGALMDVVNKIIPALQAALKKDA